MMNLPVSKVVNVAVSASPTFPARKGFGVLLIVGSSLTLPLGDRIRHYADMTGVAADFASTTEEYFAAAMAFGQSPRPVDIAIGRRLAAAAPGELLGSVNYQKTLATWQLITTGAFAVTVDGVLKQVTGCDFSAVSSMSAIAAVIQTRMQVAAAGSTCTFDGSRFVLRSGTTGAASAISYTAAPATGADIGGLMGTRAADLGVVTSGADAESVTASLDALASLDSAWYGFSLTKEATEAQILAAAAWTEARVKLFGYTSSASGVQDASTTNDIASQLHDLGYRRTFGMWDQTDPYAHVSAMARAFVVNFNEQNATITLKFKQLPGTTPQQLSATQQATLDRKCANYYARFGDSPMLAEGKMASGEFFDQVHGLDWLQNAVETNVFGYLYTRVTKVPQTDKGVALIVQQCEKAMDEAANNGLIAPGVWTGDALGAIQPGDYLKTGYYVHAQKVAAQNSSDRAARKAPPIQIIATGAGAIHSVNVSLVFQP